jgi:hypothetical protein
MKLDVPVYTLILVLLCSCGQTMAQLPTRSDIVEAQKNRLANVSNYNLTWSYIRKKTIEESSREWSEETVTLKSNAEMIVEGKSTWMIRNQDMWHSSRKMMVDPLRSTEVFHDGIGKKYQANRKIAVVDDRDPARSSSITSKLNASLRTNSTFLTSDRYQVLRRENMDDGAMIVIGNEDWKENNDNRKATRDDYFLDENRGYILSRVNILHSDGQVLSEWDIDYDEDPVVGYVPKSIRWIQYAWSENGDSIVTDDYDITVETVEFNIDIPDDLFQFEFPVGTKVHDRISGARYVAGE